MLILKRLLHTGGPETLSVKNMSRLVHTGSKPGTLSLQSKSNLAKLRKRTGFSFVNCKKALQQFDQDIDKVSESNL